MSSVNSVTYPFPIPSCMLMTSKRTIRIKGCADDDIRNGRPLMQITRNNPLTVRGRNDDFARTLRKCVEHRYLLLMLVPVLAYYLVFNYAPMFNH